MGSSNEIKSEINKQIKTKEIPKKGVINDKNHELRKGGKV